MKAVSSTHRSLAMQYLTSRPQVFGTSRARLLNTTPPSLAKNRIYDPYVLRHHGFRQSWATRKSPKADIDTHSVRSASDLDNLILLSASSRTALITLWTAAWCPSCRVISPFIRQLIEEDGAGEGRGGVGYAEIEFDSPTLGDVTGRYGL